jgi:hypothetical protein
MSIRSSVVPSRTRSLSATRSFLLTALIAAAPATAWAQVSTYQTVRIVDPIVNNVDATLSVNDRQSDSENSIGINPQNPRELVVLGFAESFTSNTNGALFHSTDGGVTWTKNLSIPQPPGINGFINDQTLDWGRNNQLAMTFLTTGNVVTVATTNPTSPAAYNYRVVAGATQLTNHLTTGSVGGTDQPWTLTNRDTAIATQDNVYTTYDDFNNTDGIDGPDMHVVVSYGVAPLDFTVDVQVGNSTGGINPGMRLAKDPASGIMYAIWQRCSGNCGGNPKTIDYMLNRSIDGGHSWTINGSSTGVVIATANSTQPTPKLGAVNALLGGVDHATVDPRNGAVYYVYGNRDNNGIDRIALRRLTFSAGNVTIGNEVIVTSLESALPQVAVDANGTVAVFFYSFDGVGANGLPNFRTHLSLSDNQGATFTDQTLLTFQSPVPGDGDDNDRQRVFGDYQQMKSLGTCFYGTFTANGAPLGRPVNDTDPVYFQVCQNANPCVLASGALNVGMDVSDRTQITGAVSSGGLLQIGSHTTITGNVQVNNNAFLRDNAAVTGNVTLAGVLQHQNIFTITGTLTEHATVTIPTLQTRTVTVGTGNPSIANNAVVTLSPGPFGNMTINAGAHVTLLAGTYNFASLNVQPDVLFIDNAATNVNVAGALTWSDRVKVQSTLAHPLTLYTNATSIRLGTDGIFKGFLIAPNATLDVASRTSFQGCLGGRDVTFEPDVTFTSGGSLLPLSATQ